MSTKEGAILVWASDNPYPCFCNDEIRFNVNRIEATPETLAALYGISNPESISVTGVEGDKIDLIAEFCAESDHMKEFWPLESNDHYQVHSAEPAPPTPINKIFHLFPGDTDDEKTDRVEQLSKNFYRKIWEAADVPEDFRKCACQAHTTTSTTTIGVPILHFSRLFSHPSFSTTLYYTVFQNRFSSSDIQAFRQFNWFMEVFGGPKNGGADATQMLLNRTMAKHPSRIMSVPHAKTWISLMNQAMMEEFPGERSLHHHLSLYWLHFYAFFPYQDEDRRAFRQLASWE